MNRNSVFAFIILLSTIVLTSCLAATHLVPTGGSKAEGTVEMSAEYRSELDVRIDWEHASAKAYLKCKEWGYCRAEWYPESVRECLILDETGCLLYKVTYFAQCIECDTGPVDWHNR